MTEPAGLGPVADPPLRFRGFCCCGAMTDKPQVEYPTGEPDLRHKLDGHLAVLDARENVCWDDVTLLEELVGLLVLQLLRRQQLIVGQNVEGSIRTTSPIAD